MKSGAHSWDLLGGAGGWEMWQCENCKRSAIPSAFGFLWPDVLRRLSPGRFGCPGPQADLPVPSREPCTHDYRRPSCGWGHDYGIRKVHDDGASLTAYGWGRVSAGDYLVLSNGDGETRYRVGEDLRVPMDPGDQWFCTLHFAPREEASA